MSEIRSEFFFTMVPDWVVRADISANAVRLYAALGRYSNMPHGAVPSRQTLAGEWMHCSLDTVDRAKAELVRIGALEIKTRKGRPNRYILMQSEPNSRTRAEGSVGQVVHLNGRTGAAPTLGTRAARKKDTERKKDEPKDPARVRNALWDALVEILGPAETETAKSLRGKVLRSLLKAGASPEQVLAAPERYHERMPPQTLLTDSSLEKYWGMLWLPVEKVNGSKRNGRGGVSTERLAQL